MHKIYCIILLSLYTAVFCSCNAQVQKNNTYQVKYLDEYVIYNDTTFSGSKIGGLSGIEYHQEQDAYYIVCDDSKNPRFYRASITLEKNRFKTIAFDQLITIKDRKNQFLNKNTLDLEAIRTFGKSQFIFSNEGSIKHRRNPTIFITDISGNYKHQFTLPSYFLANNESKNKPRHNGVFEGLASNIDHTGYWASMELPLQLDGAEPTITTGGAPVRITHFSKNTGQADFQFTYPLDKLAKDPKEKFGVNGVTDLLQLSQHEFIIVERGYSAGYGTQGNTVRIYVCTTKGVTNTLDLASIKNQPHQSVDKQLLFDFEIIRDQLTNQIIDNIEGITLGPILANGNQSLILISDNNFNPISKQINQLILLELIKTY